MLDYLHRGLQIYNSYFVLVVLVLVIFLIIIVFQVKSNNDNELWYNLKYVIKKKISEMLMYGVCCFFLIIFLEGIFAINVIESFKLSECWKALFSVWIAVNFLSGKKMYRDLKFYGYLHKVVDDVLAERKLEEMISRERAQYILEAQKLGILKSLAPISLISFVAGYIIEGKDITMNLNWYTIVFFGFIVTYIYNLWKCYENIKFWKRREVEVQNELRKYQSKKK